MDIALDQLSDDVAALKAMIVAQHAQTTRLEVSVKAYGAMVEALKLRIARLRRQKSCLDCGGPLRVLSEDVSEVLEYVAAKRSVIETHRPKKSCRQCEKISQMPAPTRPVPRGMAGPALLAHILMAKFDDHLPLYRQGEIPSSRAEQIAGALRKPVDQGRRQANLRRTGYFQRLSDAIRFQRRLVRPFETFPDIEPVRDGALGVLCYRQGRLLQFPRQPFSKKGIDVNGACERIGDCLLAEKGDRRCRDWCSCASSRRYASRDDRCQGRPTLPRRGRRGGRTRPDGLLQRHRRS